LNATKPKIFACPFNATQAYLYTTRRGALRYEIDTLEVC